MDAAALPALFIGLDILIIKPSSLGDIIHGLQVAQSLKAQLPWARITWVAREIFAPLVEECACVDEVIVFHRKKGLRGLRQTIRAIKQREYDWVLDMQGLARSAYMTWHARAQHKAGRRDGREGAQLAYALQPQLPPAGKQAHALEILTAFLPLMNLQPEPSRPLVFREEVGGEPLPEFIRGALVLFPGSRRAEKEWPRFRELTSELLATMPEVKIVWAGDQPVEAAKHWSKERFLNLTGKTSLPQLVPLIREARLCVCNDSGPMHLAAAMGTELVAIFGPTPPTRFGPWPLSDPRHHVLPAPNGNLGALEVDSVAEVIRGVLA